MAYQSGGGCQRIHLANPNEQQAQVSEKCFASIALVSEDSDFMTRSCAFNFGNTDLEINCDDLMHRSYLLLKLAHSSMEQVLCRQLLAPRKWFGSQIKPAICQAKKLALFY